ncbi:GTP-binding protein [Rhizobium leguminosarum bv. trifolii]|jgi:ribosomal protection tetracycline resistance protein|uniref:GTP-binding protein n=1 Tax=Rhizobium leguminosarum bv. trifolii TaxID=386 RepID=A0A1B8RF52_RHILT|nr:TetM/TetW/TetO/TetS family tetracycline resistance ribosomal protection protein [Rhizobium leguminosarum]AOO89600.1 GTP-binding protein [Rhizobium leguminosarum bv. trifolii]MBY5917970.1 TetM/TetW/TetO/TetS family tetracycline resistance ribosomal protection protein [Rhizobium leguminosarum]NKK91368.1 GTP-binding protein [Rhizobium leguminosarum bv. viciae]OBY07462.1 GTP-binding protein [Rhizobium leguminosarum bv. trifolii]TBE55502.1 TetM/TetW/TetO/TetS family tetracycline resistance ribos
MRTLNLGILAHVDAGKTSLTERLLFNAGVIDKLGSVDTGNTQTDTLELERQRGITIRAAVVSFVIGERVVNLIDTPGHPDFIAEIERVLGLLDAAVVVVSAVEGVQAQTRVLVRALRRLGVPFIFFVNKVDRPGARYRDVMEVLAAQLAVRPIAMSSVIDAGAKLARVEALAPGDEPLFSALCETLGENDEALLDDYVVAPDRLTEARLWRCLADQVARGLVHPVFAGAAMTGAGIPALASAIATILPERRPDPDGPVAGKIFKIERGWGGEKLSYIYLNSGTVRLRQSLGLPKGPERVTAIHVFEAGRVHGAESLRAGQIARVSGLAGARIGDAVGGNPLGEWAHFAPPALETRVLARRPSDKAALWLALNQMAEQDPLINLRRNEEADEVYVSLYGEVQKEVIQSTLLTDFGLEARFEESTVILVERPLGTGSGLQILFKEPNPFLATVGLRVEPRAPGAGNSFALEVDVGQMPVAFYRAVEETVFETLKQGIFGWQVADCHVAMTAARHSSPASTAADFRQLTPWVLADALLAAQTVLCAPIDRFYLEAPVECLNGLLTLLAKSAATTMDSVIADGMARLEGTMASAMIQSVQQQLPGLTSGAGTMETCFDHYAPMAGPPRSRQRSGPDPFNGAEYLLSLHRHVEGMS